MERASSGSFLAPNRNRSTTRMKIHSGPPGKLIFQPPPLAERGGHVASHELHLLQVGDLERKRSEGDHDFLDVQIDQLSQLVDDLGRRARKPISPELIPGYSSVTVRPEDPPRRPLHEPFEARARVALVGSHQDVGAGRPPKRREIAAGGLTRAPGRGHPPFVCLDRAEPREVPPVGAAGDCLEETVALPPDPDRRARALDGSRPAYGPLDRVVAAPELELLSVEQSPHDL